MIAGYFKVAIRNMQRHFLFSWINVMSLAVGIATCILIYLFIQEEKSFDSFHSKREHVYRLNERQKTSDGSFQKVALTGSPFGPDMLKEFPEIRNFTRVESIGTQLFSRDDKRVLSPRRVVSVDSSFLTLFDFPLLYGDRNTLFDSPNSIALTEDMARLFFPDASSALDQTIIMGDDKTRFKITGVFKNLPENSHIQFDAATSLATYIQHHPEFNTDWTGNFLCTYFLLHENVNPKQIEAKIPKWLARWTEVADINTWFGIYFQPLETIHLGSADVEHDYINYRKFNGKYLGVFMTTGLFILLIASVNFMNLTTARASHRWKEVGVRKIIGARQRQLFLQFIYESVLLSGIALVFALIMDFMFLPLLSKWIGRPLDLFSLLLDVDRMMFVFGSVVLLGMMAAFYPSVYMASVDLIKALKGNLIRQSKSVFQSSLVVIQFALAIGFMISALVVMQQLNFVKQSDLGFTKDKMMLVSLNKEANTKFELLKAELLKSKYVAGVTASGQRMGNNFHQTGFKVKTDSVEKGAFASHLNVDYDYLEVYDIPVIQGRAFSPYVKSDNGKAFIINQSMQRELDLKSPVGIPAHFDSDSMGTVIGVVGNFKFNSLHYRVASLSLICNPKWGYDELSIKLSGDRLDVAIADVKRIWEKIIADFPFSYSFLDDHLEELYHNDQELGVVVTMMTVLAILISCMGLFGLAAIATERKTKEIGIRKVLGANEMQIVVLLSRNFALLVLVSFVLACPITYQLLSVWLQNFAYRIEIKPVLFMLSGALTLFIALLTISFYTLRTARSNPVNSLKNE